MILFNVNTQQSKESPTKQPEKQPAPTSTRPGLHYHYRTMEPPSYNHGTTTRPVYTRVTHRYRFTWMDQSTTNKPNRNITSNKIYFSSQVKPLVEIPIVQSFNPATSTAAPNTPQTTQIIKYFLSTSGTTVTPVMKHDPMLTTQSSKKSNSTTIKYKEVIKIAAT